MITYDFKLNGNKAILQVIVKLERKIIGHINPIKGGGWQYVSKGSKHCGEVMKTIALVQKSLKK